MFRLSPLFVASTSGQHYGESNYPQLLVAVFRFHDHSLLLIKNPADPDQLMLPVVTSVSGLTLGESAELCFGQLTKFRTTPAGWGKHKVVCDDGKEVWVCTYIEMPESFQEYFCDNVVIIPDQWKLDGWSVYPPHEDVIRQILPPNRD